jgi:hypothetical protein
MLLTNNCLVQSLFLPRADSGTFSVPGRVSPGRGRYGLDSGTSRAIRDGWQPGMWCLETCLGLETVSRPDSEVLVLVSVLKKKVLVLVSVLRKKVLVLVSVLRPKVLMSWSRDQDQDIKLRLCFNVLEKCETSVACIKKLMFHEQRRKCTPENTILTARPVFVLKLNTVVWDHCLHEFHRYGR